MKLLSVTQDPRRYYLTVDKDRGGGMIAVISLGSPQVGDRNVTVCSATRCKNRKAAKKWFREQMATKPWQTIQQTIPIPEGLGHVTGLRTEHGKLIADTESGTPMIVPIQNQD